MDPTFSASVKRSPAPAVLFACTAVGTLLSGVLPLSDYGDGKLFDTGTLYIIALGVPAALLVLAAVMCSTKPEMAGLGGGASLGVASLLGGLAILLWKTTEGEGLGAGTYAMTVTAILALVAAVVSLGVPRTGVGTPAHWLAVVAGLAMCIGCTLVPSEMADYGTTWKDFNGFGEGADLVLTFAIQIMLWMPLVALLIGAVKGGRFGALFGLGGSLILAWFVFASKAEVVTDGYVQAFSLSTDVHPLAIVGAVAVLVLVFVALAASPASEAGPPFGATDAPFGATAAIGANPGRWADDPFGRHASRYWSGTAWTDQVANGGVTSVDPAVAHPAPPPAQPTSSQPTTQFAAHPPAAAQPLPAPQPTAPQPPMGPAAGLIAVPQSMSLDEATVRRIAGNKPASTSLAELVLDTGQRIVLVGPLVIGRAPRAQPSEPAATLLVVDDSTMSVSATHLMVGPAPGGAWVEDIGSTNGSAVVDPSGVRTVLLPGVRSLASSGSSIHFGDRSARLLAGAQN